MRTTGGLCAHCSTEVEWSELRGAYVDALGGDSCPEGEGHNVPEVES